MWYNVYINMNTEELPSLIKGMFSKVNFWLGLFILFIIFINLNFINALNDNTPYNSRWSFGGPIQSNSKTATSIDFESKLVSSYQASHSENGEASFIYVEDGTAIGSSYPYSKVIPTRQGLKKYKVSEGDTLSEIAAQFGVTLDTIKWANLDVGSVISPGDELTILPVSGILYKVESQDTLESVSAKYRINPELIKKYNPDYQKLFESPMQIVILPYAKPINKWSYISQYKENLPSLPNYFSLPARGWNWGELHYYNAIDIAADCGKPIYAAAEGLVIKESDENRWNEGYGNYILIEHPNGTKTKYAHTLENEVSEGDYVLQGEQIALIGNTGNTDGPTGCHLHFEVYGAKNPFAVK